MSGAGSRLAVMLLAGTLCCLSGCDFGRAHNPSYFPNRFPFGDITQTHAKPGGGSYYGNYDPHAIRLEVRPKEDCTKPVRTPYVLIATVYDQDNEPRRKRRIEWLVEGVGNILEVDESGVSASRGYKVSSKYAVSYTDCREHTITRGNNNPNDDFTVRPGQSWCVISSAIEGDTHVTVYAPEIHDWDKGKVYVNCHWIDANWIFPPSAAVRAGAEHVLTTKILRHTDQRPLANYRVRYFIQEGPEAIFVPAGTREFTAVSDLNGNAHATIKELAPVPGISKVGIEIIRPPDPTSPSGAAIPIAKGETTVEWLAPAVVLAHTGPPAAGLGQEVTFATSVTNNGKVETRSMTVTGVIPDGLQYLRSTPPAFSDGRALTWALGTLPQGQAHNIQAVYRALKPGPVTSCVTLQTEEGFKDEKCFTTQVTAPGLKVLLSAPATAPINTPINYQITLTNTGTTPVENMQLTAQFDPGLEHETKANPVTLNKDRFAGLASLAPGATQTVALFLTARQLGRQNAKVTVTADGGLADVADAVVVVEQGGAPAPVPPAPIPPAPIPPVPVPPQGKLTLAIEGPRSKVVNEQAGFIVRVGNAGGAPLANVVVRNRLPAELGFVSAGQGGQLAGNEVVWNVGALQPKEEKILQLNVNCQKLAAAAVQQATAAGEPGAKADAQAAIEIRGIPAFQLKVGDDVDPIEVGKRLTYKITVTNTGSLPANQVEIKAIVPPEMKVVHAHGPVEPNIAGQVVTFKKLDNLEPGKAYLYTVEVEGMRAGDVRFRAEMTAPALTAGPVVETESSSIIAPAGAPK